MRTSGDDRAATEREGRVTGTVAWVDVRTTTSVRRGRPTGVSAMAYALRKIAQAVRGDDRICPASTTLAAVAFGPVAGAVPLRVLGDRLARAVGPGLLFDRSDTGFSTAVGLAGPIEGPGADGTAGVTRRVLAAARTSRAALGRDAGDPDAAVAAVTVDQRVTGHPSPGGTAPLFVPLHRRPVRRYLGVRTGGVPGLCPADERERLAAREGPRPVSSRCVLVVDPMAAEGDPPGFALTAAAAVIERLGCRTDATPVSPEVPLPVTVDGVDADLVVLVLDGAWVGRSPSWGHGAWGRPARLTTAYVDKGVPVLAVSVGAGAGAMAACVAQGALALFDPDHLAEALRSLERLSSEEARQMEELEFPDRFHALLSLTAGERRVLFYLTEGWGAQEIADELVVSLTTVRSHIRSVLRKLGVRSQLAAVAMANSRDLEHHAGGA